MSSASKPPAALRMTGIEKRFGPVRACQGAGIEVAPGEIHALVGENGAGKSTLMRILSGMLEPDGGRVEVGGVDVTGWSTAQAIGTGVAMVHQHFMLVPTLTVAENVVLGREPMRAGTFDRDRAIDEVRELAERSKLLVDPERLVSDLSLGEAQRVEILKTLYRGARILLLDEPTAVLSPPEVEELWSVLRRLRDGGATIVLMTHKLGEVMGITDRLTVMRRGRTVADLTTRDTTPEEIARAMVGRDVHRPLHAGGGPARSGAGLEVRSLVVHDAGGARRVQGVDFDVPPGTVLGIAGVEGNGQAELAAAIAGLRPVESGRVYLGGRDVTTATVRERVDAGLSYVPEDRQRHGLVLDYSVAENLILGEQRRFSKHGTIDRDAVRAHAARQVEDFDIRPGDPSAPARNLSGGNQQKVVIARQLTRPFTVLLAAQPTRGVDVGAIELIHAALRRSRDEGKSILLVSADLSEVLALSDRIAVMYRGRIVAVFPRAEASEERIGRCMTGAQTGTAA